MLKRIHIKGYKSIRDLDIRLENFCVLFGPNAAGKSNFLDALQLLGRLVSTETLTKAFDPPYRGAPLESFAFPEKGLKGLLEQESARFSFDADVELSDDTIEKVDRIIRELRQTKMVKEDEASYGQERTSKYVRERFLRYRVEIEVVPRSGILRITDEDLRAITPDGSPKTSRRAFLENMGGNLHLRQEGSHAHPTYHDLLLDHSVLSRRLYPPHYPHVTALKTEMENWSFYYFEPRERMRRNNPVKEVKHIGLMGEELAAFLNTLRAVDERQLKGIEKALHAFIPSVTGVNVEVNDLGEVELHILEGNASIPARVVSEGTLRMLGLLSLSSVKEPASLIGLEEPENGIHPRRIRLIAELLQTQAQQSGPQIIVTTHSPLLPDMIPDKNLYVCRKAEGKTLIEPFSAWGPLARKATIDHALDESGAKSDLRVSERILRGDFDA